MNGKIIVLDRTGHTEVVWNTEVKEQVDQAATEFSRLLLEGHLPTMGNPARMIEEFDPEVDTITFIPPLQGG